MVLLGVCPSQGGRARGTWGTVSECVLVHRCCGGLRVRGLLASVLRGQRPAVQGHDGDSTPAGPADHRRYGPHTSLGGSPGPLPQAAPSTNGTLLMFKALLIDVICVQSLPSCHRSHVYTVTSLRLIVTPSQYLVPLRSFEDPPVSRAMARAPRPHPFRCGPSRHPLPLALVWTSCPWASPASSLGALIPSRVPPWLHGASRGPHISGLLSCQPWYVASILKATSGAEKTLGDLITPAFQAGGRGQMNVPKIPAGKSIAISWAGPSPGATLASGGVAS